jgi:hypothetical protein
MGAERAGSSSVGPKVSLRPIDHVERQWWVFQLPEAVAFVPAATEQKARNVLDATSYRGAPVDSWPCIGSRWTTGERIMRENLRRK